MTDILIKRGSDAQHAAYVGGNGELTRNTDTGAVHIHDGVTAGGDALALKSDLDGKVDKVTGKGLSTEDYTSEEKSKLAGIEANATGDQTASEILTAIKTVDGSGSGLDADLLDGQHATDFAAALHGHAISDVTGLQTALDSKQATLGFTPVQQGGGTGQGTNKVYIGWASDASGLMAQVDATNFGISWPINITKNAATATKLANARNIALSGDVTGSVSFDGSGNVTIDATVTDNSHAHSNYLLSTDGTGTNTQLNAMRVRAVSAQSGTSFAINYNNGDLFPCTATGNAAVTFSNFPAGAVACGIIKAINWGGKTITFPVGTKIVGGSLSLTTSGTDFLGLVWDGSVMSVTLMAKDVK